MTTPDPIAHLDFAPTCEYDHCTGEAYRIHRPPCRCFAALLCLPHTLKTRLELEITGTAFLACPACGRLFPTELLEHRLPRHNP